MHDQRAGAVEVGVARQAWRLVREAAWPGLVVLVAHAVLGELFGHEPYVDPVMHVLGGAAAAFFFSRLPRLAPATLGDPTPAARYLLAFGLTCAVALFWEFGEHAADLYLATHAQRRAMSTLRDLLNGVIGAAAFIAGDLILRRRRSDRLPAAQRNRSIRRRESTE